MHNREMLIDGKQLAHELLESLQVQRKRFGTLRLGVLMSEGDRVAASFVRIKLSVAAQLSVEMVCKKLSPGATTHEAVTALTLLQKEVEGVIVQLPLPPSIDLEEVLGSLLPEKDVDGIGTQGKSKVFAPVPAAMAEILTRAHVELPGKQVLVVGQGRLVGKPAVAWLHTQGVSPVIALTVEEVMQHAPTADIIVLGAGSPGVLQPSMIKEGVIILDAGTSEIQGKVVGDADPSCAQKAAIFTPVPGGIGPIAVAELFNNFFFLAEKSLLPSI